jgi:hypothetical protein
MSTDSWLPVRTKGRPTTVSNARYEAKLATCAATIKEIRSRLEFAPSSRGWCYVLEGEGLITKGEFDTAQRVINDLRKGGLLPLDICSEDQRRAADGVERLDDDIPDEIDAWIKALTEAPDSYAPISFWDDQEYYIELAVEKVDLKHLFAPICQEFRIPVQNIAGWADLHSRAAMMRRFDEHEAEGRQPVMIYCGDHDPGGLNISKFLRSNLEELSDAVGWHPDNLIIDRFGLDYDFIEQLGLTWIDNLETGSGDRLDDPRHRDHKKDYVQNYLKRFGARKVEANALIVRPTEGRELCRQAILKYLPEDAPAEYEERLIPYRAEIKEAISKRLGDVK